MIKAEDLVPDSLDSTKPARRSVVTTWSRRAPAWGFMERAQQSRISALVALMVALFLFFALTQARFATASNLKGILSGVAVLWIVTIGVSFVMIGGGFDLSVGAILTLSGYVMAEALTAWHWPIWLALPLGLLAATAMGAGVNGVLIGRFKLSFLVVTLGTMSLFGGITSIWAGLNDSEAAGGRLLQDIGFGSTVGIPNSVVIAICVSAAGWYLLRWTFFGRDIYALGGNPEAARLAGINVGLTTIAIYGVAGLCAGIATVAQVGLLQSASSQVSQNLTLQAATAALLGGISLGGGTGTVLGSCVGVIFVGILDNGLQVMGVSAGWQSAVLGAALIFAIALDLLRKRKIERSRATAGPRPVAPSVETNALAVDQIRA